MADPVVISALKRKRNEIENTIAAYEKRIEMARRDLSHVKVSLRVFEANGKPADLPAYTDIHRLFRRGEIINICKEALANEGELNTRELALRVIRVKGLDETDAVLRKTLAYRIVQALRFQWKRGQLDSPGKFQGVRIWRLSD